MPGQGSLSSLMSRLAFSEQSAFSSHLQRKLSCQLPSKMTDLRDKKMHLDLILWNVRTRWKESQKLKSHWEPSKIIKREINNAWHKKWQGYNLNENIWNRTKDTKSWKYVKYLLRLPKIKKNLPSKQPKYTSRYFGIFGQGSPPKLLFSAEISQFCWLLHLENK